MDDWSSISAPLELSVEDTSWAAFACGGADAASVSTSYFCSSAIGEFPWLLTPDAAGPPPDRDVVAELIAPPAKEEHRSPAALGRAAEKEASAAAEDASSSSSGDPQAAAGAPGGNPAGPAIINKGTKKGLIKRSRQQPRYAFMTKSDVEHLEDGYRWRKYGQKAVKNSSHPRSYYRCTNSRCQVKKRVERSSDDPSVVITTYEGQHCHHAAAFPRAGHVGAAATAALAQQFPASAPSLYYSVLPVQLHGSQSVGEWPQSRPASAQDQYTHALTEQLQTTMVPADDHGFLGDIYMVPVGMATYNR